MFCMYICMSMVDSNIYVACNACIHIFMDVMFECRYICMCDVRYMNVGIYACMWYACVL